MKSKKGFTLVELLVTITIVLILALIIIANVPQFINRAKEAKTRDYLANLRIAIGNYYSANQGVWPVALDDKSYPAPGNPTQTLPSFIPHFMLVIPPAKIRSGLPSADVSSKVTVVTTEPNNTVGPEQITDEGGWIYSSNSGDLRVNSKGIDSKQKLYYSSYGHEE